MIFKRLLVLPLPSAILFALLLSSAASSCGSGSSASAAGAGSEHPPAQEIRDLIAALTPPPATSVPVVKSDWFLTRKRTLERLQRADHAVGLEALRVFREEPPSLPEVRSGLLGIAAHAAPEETTPLLVQLTTVFGEDLGVRRSAAEFLGECAPQRAVEVLEPILREHSDGRTYPPEERMLAAWLVAEKKLGLDPAPLLSMIATDIQRQMDVRHLAARSLGEFDSPQSRQALQVILVESTGNAYIRRLALQSLKALLPKADFCALAKDVQAHEADLQFIEFLESALNADCR